MCVCVCDVISDMKTKKEKEKKDTKKVKTRSKKRRKRQGRGGRDLQQYCVTDSHIRHVMTLTLITEASRKS